MVFREVSYKYNNTSNFEIGSHSSELDPFQEKSVMKVARAYIAQPATTILLTELRRVTYGIMTVNILVKS